jgi:Heterokaryon incompatibility protein (HET)
MVLLIFCLALAAACFGNASASDFEAQRYIEGRIRSGPYSPLPSKNHTRLVVFAPRCGDEDRLYAMLEVVDLGDNPVYEAVSYAWGKPCFTAKNVFIDGNKISFRHNLWAFLQRLGGDGRPRKLWIDALSIC